MVLRSLPQRSKEAKKQRSNEAKKQRSKEAKKEGRREFRLIAVLRSTQAKFPEKTM
ncbi:MAG: hypothetical protein WAL95_06835 [Candidatus Acidiferrales bacterium]